MAADPGVPGGPSAGPPPNTSVNDFASLGMANTKKRDRSEDESQNVPGKRPRLLQGPSPKAVMSAQASPFWRAGGRTKISTLDNRFSDRRRKAWLERSKRWEQLPKGFVGDRVLGAGGYGLCGLWRYEGEDENYPRHLVVKQTGYGKAKNTGPAEFIGYTLKREAHLLQLCMSTGSEHIVKIYKDYHVEMGTGTYEAWDPADQDVGRIYLEYCDGGDMDSFIRKTVRHEITREQVGAIYEEVLWRIWHCLVTALLVLERGTENRKDPPWDERPIAHFDIKPHNILIKKIDSVHAIDLSVAVPRKSPVDLNKVETFIDDYQGKKENNTKPKDEFNAKENRKEDDNNHKTSVDLDDIENFVDRFQDIKTDDPKPGEASNSEKTGKQVDSNHQKLGMIFKLADFGIAMQVPKNQRSSRWREKVHGRATQGWIPPEQQNPYNPGGTALVGIPTNIFAAANCIYVLLMRGRRFSGVRNLFKFIRDPREKNFEKPLRILGSEMHTNPPSRYSKMLRSLISRCLAVDPSERPTASELLNHMELVLQEYDKLAENGDGGFSNERPQGGLIDRYNLLDPEPQPPPAPQKGKSLSDTDFILPIIDVDPMARLDMGTPLRALTPSPTK